MPPAKRHHTKTPSESHLPFQHTYIKLPNQKKGRKSFQPAKTLALDLVRNLEPIDVRKVHSASVRDRERACSLMNGRDTDVVLRALAAASGKEQKRKRERDTLPPALDGYGRGKRGASVSDRAKDDYTYEFDEVDEKPRTKRRSSSLVAVSRTPRDPALSTAPMARSASAHAHGHHSVSSPSPNLAPQPFHPYPYPGGPAPALLAAPHLAVPLNPSPLSHSFGP